MTAISRENRENHMSFGNTTVMTGINITTSREYEIPEAPHGGLILEMIRANVCGSDVSVLAGGHPLVGEGCVMGHEGVGRVMKLGDDKTSDSAGAALSIGDRVAVTYFQACQTCPECNDGHPNICRNAYTGWSTQADSQAHFYGTFGTHYVVGTNQAVYKVPDNVSSKAASFANCALSQVYYGSLLGEVRYGKTVVIFGAGGLGLCATAVASQFGANVVVVDQIASRLESARKFGAHKTINTAEIESPQERINLIKQATGGRGGDTVLEVAGSPSVFSEATRCTRPGGIMVEIGNITPDRYTDFDPGLFTRTGVQVRAAIRYPAEVLGRALELISDTPELPWETLVDKDYTIAELSDALAAAGAREVTRAGIVINE